MYEHKISKSTSPKLFYTPSPSIYISSFRSLSSTTRARVRMSRPALSLTPLPTRPTSPTSDAGSFPADDSPFQASPIHSPRPSRRPSFAQGYSSGPPGSLSRRSSMASGPRPITRAEYSGPNTPSLLSRAGSPTQPLANEKVKSRQSSFAGEHPFPGGLAGLGGRLGGLGFSQLDGGQRQLKDGEFIGSVDCGTT